MRKVVVVDDDRWALQDICVSFMFERYGFEVIAQCLKAEDALPIILEKRPDLVVTDIQMEGMNGLDLLHTCRQKNVDAFFIVISGYDLFEYAQKAVNEGADYYLLKPIDTNEVHQLMEKIVWKLGDQPTEKANDTFSDIVRFIRAHYNESITLASLSETFHLDKSYLSRLFSKNMGVTL